MSSEPDEARNTKPQPDSAWRSLDSGSPRQWGGMFGLLLIIGFPLAVVLGRLSVDLWSSAASFCQVFEAGGMLGANLFYWPGLSLFLWAGYAIPLVALRGRWVFVGFVLGIAIALVIAYWFVSGTGAMIRADPGGAAFCPSGVPEWWPSWLPS